MAFYSSHGPSHSCPQGHRSLYVQARFWIQQAVPSVQAQGYVASTEVSWNPQSCRTGLQRTQLRSL